MTGRVFKGQYGGGVVPLKWDKRKGKFFRILGSKTYL